jgi:hypothetical protein
VRVRSLLLGRLTALGLKPEVQVTTSRIRDSSIVRAATVRNVLARIPGTSPTGAIAVVAHYDAAPLSPGAGDNGVGLAMVLEASRTLLSGDPLRNDVIIVFTDADEVGQLGTRAFAEQHPWSDEVAVTVSVESRGPSGPAVLLEQLHGNGSFLEALGGDNHGHTASSLGQALSGRALESADPGTSAGHQPPTVSVTVLGGRAWEDQPQDVRQRVSERTLQHGGEQLLAAVRALGGLDLRRDLQSPGRMYLSLPRVGLVQYPSSWNAFVTLVLLLMWGLVGLLIRLRQGTRNGVLVGLGFGAATVGLSALSASGLMGVLGDIHPEYGLLHTALYHDAPHVVALAGVTLALASVLYGVARRFSRFDEVLLGGLAVPLGYVGWLTFATPAAAPSGQWPLGLALLAAALVAILGPRRGRSAWAWGLVLLLSVAVLVLVMPTLELAAWVWTLRSATALGALFGLSILLLLPVMDWLQRPRAWATPVVALAVSAALVGFYLPAVQGSVDHPEQTTLSYLTDQVAAADPILRGAPLDGDRSGARTVLGKWLTVPGPGEAWARSWVGDPLQGSSDPGTLLLESAARYEIAGTAPDARIAPPSVAVVSAAPAGDRMSVMLAVRSGLGGEMLGLVLPDDAGSEFTGVGNSSWPIGGIPTRRLVHWGVPDGGSLSIGVSTAAGTQRLEMVVLEHHLRPREVLGDYFFQRADSLVASGLLESDRVIQRTLVSVDLTAVPFSALPWE